MSEELGMVRRLWHLFEPIYSTIFYAPRAWEEVAELGYPTDARWPSQAAWRAAPLGPVGPELVTATHYVFNPRFVAEHVPACWRVAAPETVLRARRRAVDGAFRALLGDRVDGPELAEAAELAATAARGADLAGRPLAAANAALAWPEEPHLKLWHACNVLREHRGDGHVAALLTAGLDPCEALVSLAALGVAPVEAFAGRAWSDQEWAGARDRLAARGWVDDDGVATERGRAGRAEVERRTDELAARPWRVLGPAGTARFAELAMPVVFTLVGSGMFPEHNTLGMSASGV